jgi:phosphonate C-P lyase system protein PhnG
MFRIVPSPGNIISGDRNMLCNLIARIPGDHLVPIVDDLLASGTIPSPVPVREPQIGTVQIQVREPICLDRFILGDALVTTAEVVVGGTLGWAMRPGADPESAVAAAILDAWLADDNGNSPQVQRIIEQLTTLDEQRRVVEFDRLRDVLTTAIDFEELD